MEKLKQLILIKLKARGLTPHSPDVEIKDALVATASPKRCFEAVLLLREDG